MTAPAVIGTASQLADAARAVLGLAVALLDDAGYPAPSRRYLAPGRVTTLPGCEAIAVVGSRAYPGTPGLEQRTPPRGCFLPTSAQFDVVLHRCVPTVGDDGGLPDAAVLDAAGEALLEQGWVLLRGMQAILGRQPAPGRPVGVAGPLEQLRPEGGVGGWSLTVTVQL